MEAYGASESYVHDLEARVEMLKRELERANEANGLLVRRIWELEEQLGMRVAVLRFGDDEPSSEE